jgi:hypothetical protein
LNNISLDSDLAEELESDPCNTTPAISILGLVAFAFCPITLKVSGS